MNLAEGPSVHVQCVLRCQVESSAKQHRQQLAWQYLHGYGLLSQSYSPNFQENRGKFASELLSVSCSTAL